MKTLIVFFLSLIFSSNISFSQKNTQTEIIKELIVIQTLVTENRINELSNFLDKYGYLASDNGEAFFRFRMDESELTASFSIEVDNENQKYLLASIYPIDNDGNINFDLTKRERNFIWSTLFPNLENKYPWTFFSSFKQKIINNEIDGAEPGSIELISDGRYKFKFQNLNSSEPKWENWIASNFTTMMSDDNFFRYTFFGPGKLNYIEFIFPKSNEIKLYEKVQPFFYITSNIDKIWSDYTKKQNINIEFFMSLNNLDDVIWLDALSN